MFEIKYIRTASSSEITLSVLCCKGKEMNIFSATCVHSLKVWQSNALAHTNDTEQFVILLVETHFIVTSELKDRLITII